MISMIGGVTKGVILLLQGGAFGDAPCYNQPAASLAK